MRLSGRKEKGRVRIPREWYSLLPGQRLAFWVRVDRERRRRGLRKKDWDGVRQCVTHVFDGKDLSDG